MVREIKPRRIPKKQTEEKVMYTPVIKPAPKPKEDWRKIVKQLPEAKMEPTQRWYGETFYPAYNQVKAKLQALADGST